MVTAASPTRRIVNPESEAKVLQQQLAERLASLITGTGSAFVPKFEEALRAAKDSFNRANSGPVLRRRDLEALIPLFQTGIAKAA